LALKVVEDISTPKALHPRCSQGHVICPSGQHIIEKAEDGEYVCRICGTTASAINDDIYVSFDAGRQATSEDHFPIDSLKIVPIGSQHDMSSMVTKGLCMELNDLHQKDFEGHRIKPQLSEFAYVTGQLVGKGSQVLEREQFDLTLACKDKRKEGQKEPSKNHEVTGLYENPLLNGVTKWECSKCDRESKIIDVSRYLVPYAKKSFTDDTIYRNTKISANKLSLKYEFDVVTRMQYGKEVERVFRDWVTISSNILPLLAVLSLRKRMNGYGRTNDDTISQAVVNEYLKRLEHVRQILTDVLSQFNEEMQVS
jgi:hypothetical protein